MHSSRVDPSCLGAAKCITLTVHVDVIYILPTYIYIYTTLHMYIHVIYIYILYICVCICVHDTFPRLAVRSCHYCEYLPIICCVKIRVQARWIFPCHRFFFDLSGIMGNPGKTCRPKGHVEKIVIEGLPFVFRLVRVLFEKAWKHLGLNYARGVNLQQLDIDKNINQNSS